MKQTRKTERFPLSLILVAVLSLLAFLPLTLPSRGKSVQPVQGYSTSGMHSVSALHMAGHRIR